MAPCGAQLISNTPAEPAPGGATLTCLRLEAEAAHGVQPNNSVLIFMGTELFSQL